MAKDPLTRDNMLAAPVPGEEGDGGAGSDASGGTVRSGTSGGYSSSGPSSRGTSSLGGSRGGDRGTGASGSRGVVARLTSGLGATTPTGFASPPGTAHSGARRLHHEHTEEGPAGAVSLAADGAGGAGGGTTAAEKAAVAHHDPGSRNARARVRSRRGAAVVPGHHEFGAADVGSVGVEGHVGGILVIPGALDGHVTEKDKRSQKHVTISPPPSRKGQRGGGSALSSRGGSRNRKKRGRTKKKKKKKEPKGEPGEAGALFNPRYHCLVDLTAMQGRAVMAAALSFNFHTIVGVVGGRQGEVGQAACDRVLERFENLYKTELPPDRQKIRVKFVEEGEAQLGYPVGRTLRPTREALATYTYVDQDGIPHRTRKKRRGQLQRLPSRVVEWLRTKRPWTRTTPSAQRTSCRRATATGRSRTW